MSTLRTTMNAQLQLPEITFEVDNCQPFEAEFENIAVTQPAFGLCPPLMSFEAEDRE
jgi:hypothetical protein